MTRYAKVHQIAIVLCLGLGVVGTVVQVVRTTGWQMLFSPAIWVAGAFGLVYGGVLYLVLGIWVARLFAGKKPKSLASLAVVHPSFDPRVPIRTAPTLPPPQVAGLPEGVVGVIRTEKILLKDGRVIERVEGTRVVEGD
jgi:hypothetical protein